MTFVPNTDDNRFHGYCLLSEAPLGWSVAQRDNAKSALKRGIGRQSGPAHLITHGRANLNNTAWMYESSYTEEELTKEYQAAVLADELGLTYEAVFAKIEFTIFAEGGTWEQSRDAANQYIADNRAEWEGEQ
jgi:hypothetical protein